MSNMNLLNKAKGIINDNKEVYYPAKGNAGGIADSDLKYNVPKDYEGSGGGSSDLSTAQVTVVNNTDNEIFSTGGGPTIYEANEFGQGFPAMVYASAKVVAARATVVCEVPLYKGICVWKPDLYGEDFDYELSGNVFSDMGLIYIKGDGTIAIHTGV